MTTDELNTIVAAVVAELEKSGVDFDYKIETPLDTDNVFVIRGTAPNYQGVTVTWKGLLDIITAQATQAKNDAETAKNAANAILTQVTSKESNVSTMKSEVSEMKASVESTKSQVEGMKNAVETTKGQVEIMKTSIETTKEEVETMKTSVETSKSQVEANKSQVETMKTSIETTKSEVETLKSESETAKETATQKAAETTQAKGDVESMKASVEKTVADFNALAEEKKLEVQGVYQNDLNELKGDLGEFNSRVFMPNNVVIKNKLTDKSENGYYSATSGDWNASDQYRTKYHTLETDSDIYVVNKTVNQPYVFLCIYNGEISRENFVQGYKYADNNLPTEGNKLHLQKGYTIALSYYFTNSHEVFYTETTENNTLAETVQLGNAQLAQIKNIRKKNVNALCGTYGMESYPIKGYCSASDGSWNASDQYRTYFHTFDEDTDFYLDINIQKQPYVFLIVYSAPTFAMENYVIGYRLSDNNLPTESNKLHVYKGQTVAVSSYFTNTITVYYDKIAKVNDIDSEMKAVWFGDSISQYSNIADRIADITGLNIIDCSFAGSPMTFGNPTTQDAMGLLGLSSSIVSGDFSAQETALNNQKSATKDEGMWELIERQNHLNALKGLDFNEVTDIFVMLGTNDLNNAYVDTIDKFKTGMRTAISNILTAYPHIRIRFVTNPYRADITPSSPDNYGHALPNIIDAEKEVCNEYNLPLFDLYANSGINGITKSVYLSEDNLHLSKLGYSFVAKILSKWIMSC